MNGFIYKTILYTCLLVAVLDVFMITLGDRKRSIYHMLLSVCVAITDLGCVFLINCTSTEVALFCNLLLYIGGCFLPVLILRIIAGNCYLNIGDRQFRILYIISAMVYAIAFAYSDDPLYYKQVWLEQHDGVTVLYKIYGPLHNFYNAYLVLYSVVAVLILVMCLKSKKQISKKTVILYALIWILLDVVYFIQNHSDFMFNWTPVAMTFSGTLFALLLKRIDLFNVDERNMALYDRSSGNGYVTLDRKNRLAGVNKVAVEWFPELSQIPIDTNMESIQDTVFYDKIYAPLFIPHKKAQFPVQIKDRYYSARVKEVMGHSIRDNLIGWFVEITDITSGENYREMMRNYQEFLEEEVHRQTSKMTDFRYIVVTGMAEMIETRDFSTGGHVRRTSEVVHMLSEKMIESGYPAEISFLERVSQAAPMHDIGKIAIDDAILRKNGKYEPYEFDIMKTHAEKGGRLVREALSGLDDKALLEICFNVATFHHERWDGSGYPKGLKGEEIPLEARIMALADVFDALVSKRVYKEAYSYDMAFTEIADSLGKHFDPRLGKMFLECREELISLYDSFARDEDLKHDLRQEGQC